MYIDFDIRNSTTIWLIVAICFGVAAIAVSNPLLSEYLFTSAVLCYALRINDKVDKMKHYLESEHKEE